MRRSEGVREGGRRRKGVAGVGGRGEGVGEGRGGFTDAQIFWPFFYQVKVP